MVYTVLVAHCHEFEHHRGQKVLDSYWVLCWRHKLIYRVSRDRNNTLESVPSIPYIFVVVSSINSRWSRWVVPAFSGNIALFSRNKAVWASFIVLVIFATFVRLVTVLTSNHTIQFHWGIIWRFTPFTTCATSTNQVSNSCSSLSKYINFFKCL